MATTIARIQIPNASLLAANIAAATTYYIPRNAAAGFANAPLVNVNATTLGAGYIFDVSEYSGCLLVATTAGMTSAAGCVVSAQGIHPELQPLPAASQPIPIAGAGFTFSLPAIAATASTQGLAFNAVTSANRVSSVALEVAFTTLPTAGADLWVYLFGFPWKSYE